MKEFTRTIAVTFITVALVLAIAMLILTDYQHREWIQGTNRNAARIHKNLDEALQANRKEIDELRRQVAALTPAAPCDLQDFEFKPVGVE